jgi:hypothetical protein
VVEREVEGIEIEDCVALLTELFTELERYRAIVEVFQEEDFVQHVLRKV